VHAARNAICGSLKLPMNDAAATGEQILWVRRGSSTSGQNPDLSPENVTSGQNPDLSPENQSQD
jgi:hypothetical protein